MQPFDWLKSKFGRTATAPIQKFDYFQPYRVSRYTPFTAPGTPPQYEFNLPKPVPYSDEALSSPDADTRIADLLARTADVNALTERLGQLEQGNIPDPPTEMEKIQTENRARLDDLRALDERLKTQSEALTPMPTTMEMISKPFGWAQKGAEWLNAWANTAPDPSDSEATQVWKARLRGFLAGSGEAASGMVGSPLGVATTASMLLPGGLARLGLNPVVVRAAIAAGLPLDILFARQGSEMLGEAIGRSDKPMSERVMTGLGGGAMLLGGGVGALAGLGSAAKLARDFPAAAKGVWGDIFPKTPEQTALVAPVRPPSAAPGAPAAPPPAWTEGEIIPETNLLTGDIGGGALPRGVFRQPPAAAPPRAAPPGEVPPTSPGATGVRFAARDAASLTDTELQQGFFEAVLAGNQEEVARLAAEVSRRGPGAPTAPAQPPPAAPVPPPAPVAEPPVFGVAPQGVGPGVVQPNLGTLLEQPVPPPKPRPPEPPAAPPAAPVAPTPPPAPVAPPAAGRPAPVPTPVEGAVVPEAPAVVAPVSPAGKPAVPGKPGLKVRPVAPPPGEPVPPGGEYVEVDDPDSLGIDPETYQHKESDARGVTKALAGVTEWNPLAPAIMGHKRLDGSMWVADGHQRYNKYLELRAAGHDLPPLRMILLDEAKGWTVERVQRTAALQNLMEPTTDPTDIAKILRSGPLTEKESGMIPRASVAGKRVSVGEALASLGPDAYRMAVLNKEVSPEFGAAVARRFTDPAQQARAMVELKKRNFGTQMEADAFLTELAETPFVQPDIFGALPEFEQAGLITTVEQKTQLVTSVERALRSRVSAFSNVLKNAPKLTEAGNVLAGETNRTMADEARSLIGYYTKFKNAKGSATREAINHAAERIARGEIEPGAATDDIIAAVRADIERGGAPPPGAAPVRPAGAGSVPTVAGRQPGAVEPAEPAVVAPRPEPPRALTIAEEEELVSNLTPSELKTALDKLLAIRGDKSFEDPAKESLYRSMVTELSRREQMARAARGEPMRPMDEQTVEFWQQDKPQRTIELEPTTPKEPDLGTLLAGELPAKETKPAAEGLAPRGEVTEPPVPKPETLEELLDRSRVDLTTEQQAVRRAVEPIEAQMREVTGKEAPEAPPTAKLSTEAQLTEIREARSAYILKAQNMGLDAELERGIFSMDGQARDVLEKSGPLAARDFWEKGLRRLEERAKPAPKGQTPWTDLENGSYVAPPTKDFVAVRVNEGQGKALAPQLARAGFRFRSKWGQWFKNVNDDTRAATVAEAEDILGGGPREGAGAELPEPVPEAAAPAERPAPKSGKAGELQAMFENVEGSVDALPDVARLVGRSFIMDEPAVMYRLTREARAFWQNVLSDQRTLDAVNRQGPAIRPAESPTEATPEEAQQILTDLNQLIEKSNAPAPEAFGLEAEKLPAPGKRELERQYGQKNLEDLLEGEAPEPATALEHGRAVTEELPGAPVRAVAGEGAEAGGVGKLELRRAPQPTEPRLRTDDEIIEEGRKSGALVTPVPLSIREMAERKPRDLGDLMGGEEDKLQKVISELSDERLVETAADYQRFGRDPKLAEMASRELAKRRSLKVEDIESLPPEPPEPPDAWSALKPHEKSWLTQQAGLTKDQIRAMPLEELRKYQDEMTQAFQAAKARKPIAQRTDAAGNLIGRPRRREPLEPQVAEFEQFIREAQRTGELPDPANYPNFARDRVDTMRNTLARMRRLLKTAVGKKVTTEKGEELVRFLERPPERQFTDAEIAEAIEMAKGVDDFTRKYLRSAPDRVSKNEPFPEPEGGIRPPKDVQHALAQERAQWIEDGSPDALQKYAENLAQLQDREYAIQVRNHYTEAKAEPPPRDAGGEFSAGFMGSGVFEHLRDLYKRDRKAFWELMRMTGRITASGTSGLAGMEIDEDNPIGGFIKGALLGFAATSPALYRKGTYQLLGKYAKATLPRSVTGMPKETIGGRPALRLMPDAKKDISWWTLWRPGTLEHQVPELHRAVWEYINEYNNLVAHGTLRTASEKVKHLTHARYYKYAAEAAEELAEDWAKAGLKKKAVLAQELAATLRNKPTLGQQSVKKFFKKLGKDVDFNIVEKTFGKWVYRTSIGWALDSGTANATQPILGLRHYELTDLIHGYRHARTPQGIADSAHLRITRPIDVDVEDVATTITGRKPQTRLGRIANDPGIVMAVGDNYNRRVTYLAARNYAQRKLGLRGSFADDWAQEVVRTSQGDVGPTGFNPMWRGPVLGTLRPFQKFPALFAENLFDMLFQPNKVTATKAILGVIGMDYLLRNVAGVDLADAFLMGGRVMGIDPRHPIESLGNLITLQTTPAGRAGADVVRHATGTATHPLAVETGSLEDFLLNSDLAYLALTRYPQKALGTGYRFAKYGLGPHMKRTPSGAPDPVYALEDLLNLFGIKTTRQTRQTRELSELSSTVHEEQVAKKYRRNEVERLYWQARDRGDMAEAERQLARLDTIDSAIALVKQGKLGRFERLLQQASPQLRGALEKAYGAQLRQLRVPMD